MMEHNKLHIYHIFTHVVAKQTRHPTKRLDSRLSNSSEGNPGGSQESHRRVKAVRTHANGQTAGPALERGIERIPKTAASASSAKKILSGEPRIQVPRPRVLEGEIVEITPAKAPKRVKGRGKAKGQGQPLGLEKITLPSDYTNRGQIDPVSLWKDEGASFPNKLLSRFKK